MSFSQSIKNALWSFRKNRRAQFVVLVLLLLLVAAGAGYVLFGGGGAPIATSKNTNTQATQQRARRAIDGVVVGVKDANYFPTCVVIENLVAARPQSGLEQANLVYETLAEGGITRFLAVYGSGVNVEKIGPVRSARGVHLGIVQELGCLFAHAGGSPEALQAISGSAIEDFNQFYNSQYFWRDADRLKTKALEHTLYTSSTLIARALRDKDAPLVGSYDPWLFRDDAPVAERPTARKTITIDFSSFNYKVGYTYDPQKNTYLRSLAEQPQVTEEGRNITPKNIVIQYVPTKLADAAGRLQIDTIGEGLGVLFQNGQNIPVTWKKSSATERTRFYDSQEQEVHFVAGQTWVEMVPDDRGVSYL
ncbi:MAG: DUF3048 domain-containing protein [bacterium]